MLRSLYYGTILRQYYLGWVNPRIYVISALWQCILGMKDSGTLRPKKNDRGKMNQGLFVMASCIQGRLSEQFSGSQAAFRTSLIVTADIWKPEHVSLIIYIILSDSMMAKFAASVVDTSGKFATGVVGTSDKIASGVINTDGAPWLANISANFQENLERS